MSDPRNAAADPMRALLERMPLGAQLFPPNSRYQGIRTATLQAPDGTTIVYLRRRFVPPTSLFETLVEHRVTQGERLDTIAARYLGDPEQFWRICDANGAMRPAELVEMPGTALRITLPEGIPGAGHA